MLSQGIHSYLDYVMSAQALEESLRTWQKQRQQQQLTSRRNTITIRELSFGDDESLLLLAFLGAVSSLIKLVNSYILII